MLLPRLGHGLLDPISALAIRFRRIFPTHQNSPRLPNPGTQGNGAIASFYHSHRDVRQTHDPDDRKHLQESPSADEHTTIVPLPLDTIGHFHIALALSRNMYTFQLCRLHRINHQQS
jgi:hypothetical protein